jgi:hypothetical protein
MRYDSLSSSGTLHIPLFRVVLPSPDAKNALKVAQATLLISARQPYCDIATGGSMPASDLKAMP